MVFKAKQSLKGTNALVREDYSDQVAEKRKNLIANYASTRKNGEKAYLRFEN